MRRSSPWLALGLVSTVLASSCSHPGTPAYIELSDIVVAMEKPPKIDVPVLKQTAPINSSASIPAVGAKEIEMVREEDKARLRRTIDQETNQAIDEITDRLVTFYSKRIDDLSREELAKLRPLRDAQTEAFLRAIRAIFEKYAFERGPVLTRLSFLTEFPPPEELIPLEGENLTEREKARRLEIRELQRKIKALDTAYENEVSKLEEVDQQQITEATEAIQKRINEELDRINDQARNEATSQVKRFSGALTGRIFGRYRFSLPASASKQLTISSQPIAQYSVAQKPLLEASRAKLMAEANIFMELRGYVWGTKEQGASDVTEEFRKWRQKLNSTP